MGNSGSSDGSRASASERRARENQIEKLKKELQNLRDASSREIARLSKQDGHQQQIIMLTQAGCAGLIILSAGLSYFGWSRTRAMATRLAQVRARMGEMEVEMHDVRRRAALDVEKEKQLGLRKIATDLLDISDSLSSAASHLETPNKSDPAKIMDGIKLTNTALQKVLKKYSVNPIETGIGDVFNPHHHHACSVVDGGAEEGKNGLQTVHEVVQQGYLMSNIVLRPSTVVIMKNPKVAYNTLQDASKNALLVRKLDLTRSEDLICKNIICEKLEGPCACKLERFLQQTKFPNLVELSVAGTNLTVVPDSIYQLETLTRLDLSDNKLEKIDVAKLKNMKNLERVSVRGNPLRDPPASELKALLSDLALFPKMKMPEVDGER